MLNTGGADHFSPMAGSRPSMDAQDWPTSGGQWLHSSAMSSPGTSFQTSFSSTTPSVGSDASLTAPLTPSVPIKSARRAAMNGSGTPSSSTSAGSTSKTTGAKARRTSINSLPPGQKPELLPKPTRFRMKDGTGTLVAGEEEAFNKKFPSADLGDDLMQPPLLPSSSRDGDVISGYGYNAPSFVNGSSGHNAQQTMPRTVSSEVGEDEEEEEETLVRSKRRQYNIAGVIPASSTHSYVHHGKQLGSQNDAEEPIAPVESVRERIQRMNRGMH
ncbi:hypothetical protein EDD21DRAFT_362638 [Dissophora ornata]|nr:hypothetical protein EDD21DRAFT_362638 [Dissophora ornata]